MKVLGLSSHFHDSAAALVIDGRPIAASQEERFSRRKGDSSLPIRAASFCLERGGIEATDLDAVVFYEKPFRKFYRIVSTSLANAPGGFRAFKGALHSWFESKLWIKSEIAKALGVPLDRVRFSDHHLSHAAAAFLTHDVPSAATLVVDGVGEWTSTTLGRLSRAEGAMVYDVFGSVDFPHSLGLLYSALTAFLGFRVNEGEYKVMGLAPYGQPRFVPELRQLIRHPDDGLFELDLRYFSHDRSVTRGWSAELERLLGPPRNPGRPLRLGREGTEFQRCADIAASLQVVLEEELLRLFERARELTGESVLCYAGGVALNCVANGKLAREGPFSRLLIHPASGDAGGALGAALAYCASHGIYRPAGAFSPFLGLDVSSAEFAGLTFDDSGSDSGSDSFQRTQSEDEFVEHVAQALADDEVVGWMQGGAEWGPRALGARSILARPDSPGQQRRLNRMVKHREDFRPFAPVVLDEWAEELFEGLCPGRELERHMLATVTTRKAWRGRLAAVTHVDGSARVQCLRPCDGPLLHRVLARFHALTGIPALVNTSFNDAGEPIVNSLDDGLRSARRCGLGLLAAYPHLVRPAKDPVPVPAESATLEPSA
ncbi:carbamoyltransferase [Engelhardtia mirabilis]|uniref:Decarbamoylnovobiocin carbamoyltransferase n=1 Tax=Engelhardtia mirabilis TaxID=2528011 RepID=A0A518BIC1_9BACT|nr:Decarbamoylnovobiocin carbamoyltransferase [Planctomycetes bacterium Pla133]QDV01056.1 Decarbamoylnovobiocin carbamoyltransferase [Planctomycetes bacterium Pla86]